MSYQSGRNISVAYKVESAFGVLPGDTGAKIIRANSGAINLTKEAIRSNESRRDGQMTRGRHGSHAVAGQYAGDLSLGTFDDFIEAVFRGTFDVPLELDESDFTSITTGASTIVFATGSPIALGLRVGDVIRISNQATSTANNGKNLRITALDATTITVAETLVVNAVADTDCEITRPGKKLLMGTTARSFTVEEYEADIDGSEVAKGLRIGQMQLQLQPNGMAIVTFSKVGQDVEVREDSSAPYFTDPTATISVGLTSVEAAIRLGSEDILDITSLDLTINLNAAGQPVVGSKLTPDVFTNLADVQGSITALRKDMTRMKNFIDEDVLSLHLLFTQNESEPKEFCSFYLGNLTLSGATKSELGADGPRTQQIPLMIGKDERGGAFDATIVKYQTSAS